MTNKYVPSDFVTPIGIPFSENMYREMIEKMGRELSASEVLEMATEIHNINKSHVPKSSYAKVFSLIEKVNNQLISMNPSANLDITMYDRPNIKAMMYKGKTEIANFILQPLYEVVIDGETRYYFEMTNYKNIKTTIYFTQELLASFKISVNKHIKEVCGSDGVFYEKYPADALIKSLIVYQKFEQKESTGHIGLVYKNNKYYAVGVNKTYDIETGQETQDVIYSPSINNASLRSTFGNMAYAPEKFKEVARIYGENSYKLNTKMNTAIINGFLHALPHEFVFRKLAGNTSSPPLFIVGLPESGKSSTIRSIIQYMGYSENYKMMEFALQTPQAITNALKNSYNHPRIIDEYGKEGKCSVTDADIIVAAAANKGTVERGRASGGNSSDEITNPTIILGQYSPQDRSLVSRVVQVNFEGNYIMGPDGKQTESGREAKEAQDILNMQSDKNYYMGMLIHQRQLYDNEKVLEIFRGYMDYLANSESQSNRSREAVATIMTGLHCYIGMMESLGVTDHGYTEETILAIPKHVAEAKAKSENDQTELDKFMVDVENFAVATATNSTNSSASIFGTGKFIFVDEANNETYVRKEKGVQKYYTAGNKKGERAVYINIKGLYDTVSRHNPNTPNEDQIRKQIMHEFGYTLEGKSRTVLAPMGYRHSNGKSYTLFSEEEFKEKFFDVQKLEQEILDIRKQNR